MVFIELSSFVKVIDSLLSDEEQRNLQNLLLKNKTAGNLIKGTGGIRKLRFAQESKNKGKRSGTRIIYYLDEPETIYFVYAYSKGRKDDLSEEQKKALRQVVQKIKEA